MLKIVFGLVRVGTVDVLEDMKKLLAQDMLGRSTNQPNFLRAEIIITLRRTSLSNQLQNRLRFLRGESRYECLEMARDPQWKAITIYTYMHTYIHFISTRIGRVALLS